MYTRKANIILVAIVIVSVGITLPLRYTVFKEWAFDPIWDTFITVLLLSIAYDYFFNKSRWRKKSMERKNVSMYLPLNLEGEVKTRISDLGYERTKTKGDSTYYFKKGKHIFKDEVLILCKGPSFLQVKTIERYSKKFEDLLVRYRVA